MRDPKDVLNNWETIKITRPDQAEKVAQLCLKYKDRFAQVADAFKCPWWVIAAIHYRESDFDFNTWLANGDPLFHLGVPVKTHHVPKGLGPAINWVEGAALSLKHEGWKPGMDWDIVNALLHLEAYNGWGYLSHGNSPYIWAGTNHYTIGKYSSDGVYSPYMVDSQLGCAAIAKALSQP